MKPAITIAQFAEQLAIEHGITSPKKPMDHAAATITRMADDTVITDRTEDLLVELRRQRLIGGREMVDMLGVHYEQRKGV